MSATGTTKSGNTVPKPQPSRKLQFGKIQEDFVINFIGISPRHGVKNDVSEGSQYGYSNP